jgi:hypothetical protein
MRYPTIEAAGVLAYTIQRFNNVEDKLNQINQQLQQISQHLHRQEARADNARVIMRNRLVGLEMGLVPRLKEVS